MLLGGFAVFTLIGVLLALITGIAAFRDGQPKALFFMGALRVYVMFTLCLFFTSLFACSVDVHEASWYMGGAGAFALLSAMFKILLDSERNDPPQEKKRKLKLRLIHSSV